LLKAAQGDTLLTLLQPVERGGGQAKLFGKLGKRHVAALSAQKRRELFFQSVTHPAMLANNVFRLRNNLFDSRVKFSIVGSHETTGGQNSGHWAWTFPLACVRRALVRSTDPWQSDGTAKLKHKLNPNMKPNWIKLLVAGLGLLPMLTAVSPTSAQTWATVVNTNWFSIVSSADGSILYAAGGTTNVQQIFTSTNSGVNWNPTTLPMTNSLFTLAVSADGTKVFAARNLPNGAPPGATNSNPYFLSSDSGGTWTSIGPGSTTNRSFAVAMSADGNTLITAQWRQPNEWVYISTNAGASWSTNQYTSSSARNPAVFATADGGKLSFLLYPTL
jgi:hypothetical protein